MINGTIYSPASVSDVFLRQALGTTTAFYWTDYIPTLSGDCCAVVSMLISMIVLVKI